MPLPVCLSAALQMVRADEKYVKRFLKQMAALEVAGEAAQAEEDAAEAAAAAAAAASGKVVAASESTLALADLAHCEATREAAPLLAANAGELGKNAILPWWLPAEDVPPQYSGGCGNLGGQQAGRARAAWGVQGAVAAPLPAHSEPATSPVLSLSRSHSARSHPGEPHALRQDRPCDPLSRAGHHLPRPARVGSRRTVCRPLHRGGPAAL